MREAVKGILIVILVMLGAQLAVGCVTSGLMGDGDEVRGPPGWEQFCADNPEDEGCRETSRN